MICRLCPRHCDSLRTQTENKTGYCKMPLLPKVARAALHFWEEPCISGKNGSGAVFFSGCSLGCVYCQNRDISAGGFGKTISVSRLAEIFRELEENGAENINLVSPTHYVYAIKEALDIYTPKIPIVYNSGGYDAPQELKILEDYIDIYLFDLKYLSKERSEKYSGAVDYPSVATAAIKAAYKKQNNCNFDGSMLKSGIIIRHLLLPGATREAISVFDWVRNNTPNAYFSIMSQYIPTENCKNYPEINRRVTKREYDKVLDYICGTDFKNCYIQERSSSSKEYIPPFDLSGV